MEEFDIIVVGCGISGISAGYHLQKHCPWAKFEILERRSNLGGTWDLMKYPGIRSDSGMYSYGFYWRPWRSDFLISPKEEIINYLNDTVDESGLRDKIRFNANVRSCGFSSEECMWTVAVEINGDITQCKSRLVLFNTGYYDYNNPNIPHFDGIEKFNGKFMHTQLWDESYDYSNDKIVVIGSGATAATCVPAMAKKTSKMVTMLQRSPGYYVSKPGKNDPMFHKLCPVIGEDKAFKLTRWYHVFDDWTTYWKCQAFPGMMRDQIMKEIKAQVPEDFDVNTHFNPKYNPWDQRMCVVPDGDIFEEISAGRVEVVTDHIDRFVPEGIMLKSGKLLEADLVVAATGIRLQPNFPMSTIKVEIDGKPYNAQETYFYHSCMLSNVPNFAFTSGYPNVPWTLKSDLVSRHVCDLLNYMKKCKVGKVCPRPEPGIHPDESKKFFALSSNYLKRDRPSLPKQAKGPWEMSYNVMRDKIMLAYAPWGKELEFTPSARL